MTPEEKAAKDMLFIAPYDYEGLAGWLVRISWYPDANYENRKWHSKLFAFRDFASNDDALAAARNYRDKWIEENKGKRYLRSIGARFSPTLPRNNTSGIVGVNRSEKRKKSGPLWQTTYPAPGGGVENKKFPISIYGEVGALRLAIQARRAGLLAALGVRNIATDEAAYSAIKFYDDLLANLQDYRDQSSDPSVIEIVRNPDVPATTKLEQLQVRIGQQRFRREVLEFFDNKCAITGSSLLIRASHIKPWRVATNEERLNPANGLALSPVYDAAFDLGLISIRPDGQIMLSPRIESDSAALGITGAEKIDSLTDEHFAILDWHRKNIFGASMANTTLQGTLRDKAAQRP
ncbi:MAG: HNH endonuclease [Dechloromonas sp.]|nr:MAG: HNH endonuclease [Dechloromonas sp.]